MNDEIKVEILKYPTDKDWLWCKTCTLNTIGKKTAQMPTDEWKKKILAAEHSPIRELWFGIRMTVPYFCSVHYCRHSQGVNHFVQSQRNDRQDNYDRTKAPQDTMVSHIMSVNAQELIYMCHKRLCVQADPTTRKVMNMIVEEVLKTNPEFKDVLVPLCEYRNNRCTEFYPCGKY